MRNKYLTIISLCLISICAVSCTQKEIIDEKISSSLPDDFANFTDNALEGTIRVKLSHEVTELAQLEELFPDLYILEWSRTFPDAGRFEQRTRDAGLHLWYDIKFEKIVTLTKAAEILSQSEEVVKIETIQPLVPTSLPFNDPKLNLQWHYFNDASKNGFVQGADINLFEAWKIETGKSDVIVAVCDQGVLYTHEDLKDAMWINEAEYNGEVGVDDDGNGYIDDIYGYNFCYNTRNNFYGKIYPGEHGTHVAGTIGAINNNGKGLCGIAGGNGEHLGVRLMSCQTIYNNHSSSSAQAIKYAADNGAVIINNSWGYSNRHKDIETSDKEAIDYFNTYAGMDENGNQVGPMAGGLVIFSAGNDAVSDNAYPAQYEGCMAVAAFGPDFKRTSYTNYGEWVDISAPGGASEMPGGMIWSTNADNDSSYVAFQGTSMAAPHVAGVAALVVSKFGGPGFTRERLWDILIDSSNKDLFEYNYGFENKLGAGAVDAEAALLQEGSLAPDRVETIEAEAVANIIKLKWVVPADPESGKPSSFSIYCSKDFYDETVNPIIVETGKHRCGDTLEHRLDSLEFNTEYHIKIFASDSWGNISEPSDEIVVKTMENNPPEIFPMSETPFTIKPFKTDTIFFKLSDMDGHRLSCSIDTLPEGSSYQYNDTSLLVIIDGLKTKSDTYSSVITVSDGYDTTTLSFSFTVLENHAPTVIKTIDNHVFNGKSNTYSLKLSDYFTDEDGESLKYSISSSNTTIFSVTSKDGVFTFTPKNYGYADVTITAKDARGAQTSATFKVLVRDNSQKIDVYPVPFTEALYIRPTTDKKINYSLYGTSGAKVIQKETQSGPFSPEKIDGTSLSAGVYTIVIKIGEEEIVKKVVKE